MFKVGIEGQEIVNYFLRYLPVPIWTALILNLIFEVIHKQIKETEDFAEMVKIAVKNLCSYVGFVRFLQNPTQSGRERKIKILFSLKQ